MVPINPVFDAQESFDRALMQIRKERGELEWGNRLAVGPSWNWLIAGSALIASAVAFWRIQKSRASKLEKKADQAA